jgi:hypothetical protein
MTYAAVSLSTLQASLDSAARAGRLPSEISQRALPDLLRTLEVAVGTVLDIAALKMGPYGAQLEALKPLLQIPTLVIAHDANSIVEVVRAALTALANTLGPDGKRALVFVVDVAGAKDRTEV